MTQPLTHLTQPIGAFAIAVLSIIGSVETAGADVAPASITMTDGVIAPQKLTIPSGQAFALTVKNAGKTPAEFESKRLHIEQVVAPGDTATIQLPALPAGSYKFVDEFHEDLATGHGEIVAE